MFCEINYALFCSILRPAPNGRKAMINIKEVMMILVKVTKFQKIYGLEHFDKRGNVWNLIYAPRKSAR